jgi:para-aminobenzoate synthetase component 1
MPTFKEQLLYWAQDHEVVLWLDSNDYEQEYSNFDAVLALGVHDEIAARGSESFADLKAFYKKHADYLFGFFSYDLKNAIEQLNSTNFDAFDYPDLYFFQPEKLIFLKGNLAEFRYLPDCTDTLQQDLSAIRNTETEEDDSPAVTPIQLKARIDKDTYLEKIKSLQEHIHRGDIYEANFCQEFYAEDTRIDPVKVYRELNRISKPPFATFFKWQDRYLLSASPERYLMKSGSHVLSQPIKGTQKRAASQEEDRRLVRELEQNPKERAENIMIVDLVRNDLSRSALKGTVKVDELCKVYTFEQVHQLISTVSCEVGDEIHPLDLIHDTFPMGSMTGAPKISAMKIIEALEETRRGIFSGAVGYFTPDGDFDFNVVIRSIQYHGRNHYASLSVGGAITAQSDPELEFQECLLKAQAMKQVLQPDTPVNKT